MCTFWGGRERERERERERGREREGERGRERRGGKGEGERRCVFYFRTSERVRQTDSERKIHKTREIETTTDREREEKGEGGGGGWVKKRLRQTDEGGLREFER